MDRLINTNDEWVSLAEGLIDSDERIVCITTGNIMKDPTEVVDVCPKPIEVDANIDAVRRAVFG
jgi:threonine synthase